MLSCVPILREALLRRQPGLEDVLARLEGQVSGGRNGETWILCVHVMVNYGYHIPFVVSPSVLCCTAHLGGAYKYLLSVLLTGRLCERCKR